MATPNPYAADLANRDPLQALADTPNRIASLVDGWTPAQFERWTDLVAAAHNQLVLARPLAEIARRPWDARSRAASPQQVRRAMGRIPVEHVRDRSGRDLERQAGRLEVPGEHDGGASRIVETQLVAPLVPGAQHHALPVR